MNSGVSLIEDVIISYMGIRLLLLFFFFNFFSFSLSGDYLIF